MTVEVKSEETQVAVEVVSQKEEEPSSKVVGESEKKVVDEMVENVVVDEPSKPTVVEKSPSFKEESNYLSDLKECERKALTELRSKLEEAILGNTFLIKEVEKKEPENSSNECEDKEKKDGEESEKPAQKEAEPEDGPKSGGCEEEKANKEGETEEQPVEDVEVVGQKGEEEKKPDVGTEDIGVVIDRDVSIWGVPLLPSKGNEGTDVVLLKFLRARDFKVNEAFEMLRKTLQWRKDLKIDSILDEDLGSELGSVAYMDGFDRDGHPICYNIYGVFDDEELYQKTFGTEEKSTKFLKWRFQLMEKGIQKLKLKPGGVSSLLQINDLKNAPGPSKKELRSATKKAVALLQDNYPEFVARNIFINVPFWYVAVNAILSPFLTQRTKSKFVFARPAKVTETLLKYIPAEEIPIRYGGFKRDNDYEFSVEDGVVSEVFVKAGTTQTIEIPAPEDGTTLLWDLTVLGWEVKYKEEFVPTDEGSYTIIVQKGKKMGSHQEPIRNTFRNNEPGKVVITIENGSSKKKKVLYRYKTKKTSCSF